MVFILVIQLARLPIVMVRDVARDFLTHLNGILANFNYCDLQTKFRLYICKLLHFILWIVPVGSTT